MIVEPDFLNHWKTKMLVGLTGDKAAPLMVLRLWAHCQQRKAWRFPGMSNDVLKAVCEWEGEPNKLRDILIASGWIENDQEAIRVHQWEEVNWQLVRNWENGSLGGRPRKNPRETHEKPTDNPRETPLDLGLFPENPRITHEEPIEEIDRIEEIEKIDKTGDTAVSEKSENSQSSQKSGGKSRKAVLADAEFIAEVKRLYVGIDVEAEFRKMQAWLLTPRGRSKKITRRFFVNWLNRCDRPMSGADVRDKRTGLKIKGGIR